MVVVDRPWSTRVFVLMELGTAVQSVQAQLMVSEAARSNLQAQVERLGRTAGERKIGVDTRNLGRLSQFNGTDSAWRVWLVVFRSYAALVHPALKDEMQRVEKLSTAETNAGLLEGAQVQASSDLYHLLLRSTSEPALDRVVNAGSAEGLRVWQLLVEKYDPHIRSRRAGDLLAKRVSLGREDLRWLACGDCSEPSDGHRACDALVVEFRKVPDVGLFSSRVSGAYQMRRGANDSNTAPMEIDALQQHGDKKCHSCE